MTAKQKLKVISTKEAKQVLDKSIRHTARLMNECREHFGKKSPQPVTVQEFCQYFKYKIEDIYELLGWDK